MGCSLVSKDSSFFEVLFFNLDFETKGPAAAGLKKKRHWHLSFSIGEVNDSFRLRNRSFDLPEILDHSFSSVPLDLRK